MIFVTVGAQIPFDRLIRTVDEWVGEARERGEAVEVFAQIGRGGHVPVDMEHAELIPPGELTRRVSEAELVVGHAGMGTIITALEAGTPIIVLPRRGALSETRNDHQVATAERLAELGLVRAAMDEAALRDALDHRADVPRPPVDDLSASPRRASLVGALRDFIADV